MGRGVILRNSGANLLRIVASALVALLVPPFLVRALSSETYATWILVLQLSFFVNYLEFGFQSAVGRSVARAGELKDEVAQNRVVVTALALMGSIATFGLLLLALLAWQLPALFVDVPAHLLADARLTLLLVGGSLALALPGTVFGGVFVGLQRSEVLVGITVLCRVLGAVLTVGAVWLHCGITGMGAALAASNLLLALLGYLACRSLVPTLHLTSASLDRRVGLELLNYCFSLSIWSLSMLLISGLDTTIVGYFDFQAVGYFGVAVTLTNLLIQVQSALFSATMPVAAVLEAQQNTAGLNRLLLNSTRYGVFSVLVVAAPLVIAAHPLLELWVGREYADHAAPLLRMLVVGNAVRLSGLPFSNLLIGIGQQRQVVLTPLAEGGVNLCVSVLAASHLGAIGATVGTLCGALVSIGLLSLYNLPRIAELSLAPATFVREGLLRPLACGIPLLGTGLVAACWSSEAALLLFAPAVGLSLAGVWRWGLTGQERQDLSRLSLKLRARVSSNG